jgi:hypothetical protein
LRKQSLHYEFLNVGKLMVCVDRLLPSRTQHPVEQFCTMVALSGCDFALNLPWLGPKTIWKLWHRLANLNLLQPAQLRNVDFVLGHVRDAKHDARGRDQHHVVLRETRRK